MFQTAASLRKAPDHEGSSNTSTLVPIACQPVPPARSGFWLSDRRDVKTRYTISGSPRGVRSGEGKNYEDVVLNGRKGEHSSYVKGRVSLTAFTDL